MAVQTFMRVGEPQRESATHLYTAHSLNSQQRALDNRLCVSTVALYLIGPLGCKLRRDGGSGSKGIFARVDDVEESIRISLLLIHRGDGLVSRKQRVIDKEEDGGIGANLYPIPNGCC